MCRRTSRLNLHFLGDSEFTPMRSGVVKSQPRGQSMMRPVPINSVFRDVPAEVSSRYYCFDSVARGSTSLKDHDHALIELIRLHIVLNAESTVSIHPVCTRFFRSRQRILVQMGYSGCAAGLLDNGHERRVRVYFSHSNSHVARDFLKPITIHK